jgi:hypothetical protein
MVTLDTYIERNVDFVAEKETAKAGWWIRLRNDLIVGKKIYSMASLASFKDSIVLYRTFNKDLVLPNGLSFDNPLEDYSLFYLLHPPIPETKEGATWIITRGTYEFLLLIDHVDEDLINRIKTYVPCDLELDDKVRAEFGLSCRQDYLYKNKKIGSIDSMVYNNCHYINLNFNGADFTQEDRKDIDSLMKKYNDTSKLEISFGGSYDGINEYYYHCNDIGGTDITFDQLKEHFLDYFKDIIDFKIK